MLFLGDLHGDDHLIVAALAGGRYDGRTIIQVGDFGVGFRSAAAEARRLGALNEVLDDHRVRLYVVRGNHDDPAVFRDGRYNRSWLTFVPDYTLLAVDDQQVLCVGGAISVDRTARAVSGWEWWPDEGVVWQPDQVQGRPHVIVTHTAPAFCPPRDVERIAEFGLDDPSLLADIERERAALDELYRLIDRMNLRAWVYGHFHQPLRYEQDGIVFHGLDRGAFLDLT